MPPTDDTQLILTLMMTAAEVVVNDRCYKQYLCQDHSWLRSPNGDCTSVYNKGTNQSKLIVPILLNARAVLLAGNLIILNTCHCVLEHGIHEKIGLNFIN